MTYKEILQRLIEQGEKMRERQVNMDKYPRCETIKSEQEFDKLILKIKSLKNVSDTVRN